MPVSRSLPSPSAIADAIDSASRALLTGDRVAADSAIHAIAHDPPQAEARVPITRAVSARIYLRDHCRCRYCGTCCIPWCVLRLFSTLWPAELPYHAHGKTSSSHAAYWTIFASVDHVEAGSTGGDWRSESNMVTACWSCQSAKGAATLDRLGWIVREIDSADSWDGLIGSYEQLWITAGSPDPSVHAPWIRAFRAAR